MSFSSNMSETEKQEKKKQLKKTLDSFVSSAYNGINCTLLHVDDGKGIGISSSKIPIKLTLDKEMKIVELYDTANPQKDTLPLFTVPLQTAEVYDYDKWQKLHPEDATLQHIKEEDRPLSVMLVHAQKVLPIAVKDVRSHREMVQSLTVLIQRAKHFNRY